MDSETIDMIMSVVVKNAISTSTWMMEYVFEDEVPP
jgi:hypothetical protein